MKVSLADMPTSVLSTLVQQAQMTTMNSIKLIGLIGLICFSSIGYSQQVDMKQSLLVSSYVVTLVDWNDKTDESSIEEHSFTCNKQMKLESILNIDNFIVMEIENYFHLVYTHTELRGKYYMEYNLVKNRNSGAIERVTIFKYDLDMRLLKSVVYQVRQS